MNIRQYIFIISQLWLTSHPRSTVVLLDTGTLVNGREIYSEDADDGTRGVASLSPIIGMNIDRKFHNC